VPSEGEDSEGCYEAKRVRGEEQGTISFCLELYYNNGDFTAK